MATKILMNNNLNEMMNRVDNNFETVQSIRQWQVNVDQGDTVGKLVEKLHGMTGLNLVGKVNIDGQDVELTKLAIYVLKDARK